MKKSITYKTSVTGLSIALIILWQLIGKILPTGLIIAGPFSFNQLITGSLVNMTLILLTLQIGLFPAITSGIVSSILAMFLQIGPIFPQLVLFIAISNIILVTVIYFFSYLSKKTTNKKIYNVILLFLSIIIAACFKFIFLKFTIPFSFKLINNISVIQTNVLSFMFSWPQLFTALTGGFLALFANKFFTKLK